jgi:uncharacterized protein (UPF0261 family)
MPFLQIASADTKRTTLLNTDHIVTVVAQENGSGSRVTITTSLNDTIVLDYESEEAMQESFDTLQAIINGTYKGDERVKFVVQA